MNYSKRTASVLSAGDFEELLDILDLLRLLRRKKESMLAQLCTAMRFDMSLSRGRQILISSHPSIHSSIIHATLCAQKRGVIHYCGIRTIAVVRKRGIAKGCHAKSAFSGGDIQKW